MRYMYIYIYIFIHPEGSKQQYSAHKKRK